MYLPVVVAVVAGGVVEVAADEIIGVVAVGDRLVAAAGAVDVALHVPAAGVRRGAGVRVGRADRQGVLAHRAVGLGVVQVAVVQVVGVAVVLDGRVPAAGAVPVLVVRVGVRRGHGSSSGRR